MKALKFEELTTRQKLGMTLTAMLYGSNRCARRCFFDK